MNWVNRRVWRHGGTVASPSSILRAQRDLSSACHRQHRDEPHERIAVAARSSTGPGLGHTDLGATRYPWMVLSPGLAGRGWPAPSAPCLGSVSQGPGADVALWWKRFGITEGNIADSMRGRPGCTEVGFPGAAASTRSAQLGHQVVGRGGSCSGRGAPQLVVLAGRRWREQVHLVPIGCYRFGFDRSS
jgi:hypothetical protein